MVTVNEKMTALADEIRVLSGTEGTMGLDAMKSNVNTANSAVSAALSALVDKGVEVPDGSNVSGLAELIAALEVGGGIGEIFGTSKYQVGSVIGNGSVNIITPTPSWFSDIGKLNIIAFTRSTYGWDAAYFTVLIKIIRDAVTLSYYTSNDNDGFNKVTLSIKLNNGNLLISHDTYYTVPGAEYFYILWENE